MICGAVIPAAGQARRFGAGDKTLQTIAGRPVLEWTLRALIGAGDVTRIVVVVSESNESPISDLIAGLDSHVPIHAVRGGARRMDSVQAGVQALDDRCDLILIHDAARPVVQRELIQAAVIAGRTHGAAIPGVPVTDTIKRVSQNVVVSTVERSELVAVQTPQVFRRDWLMAAYAAAEPGIEATDEAAILEAAGYPVHVIPGDPSNIKVTIARDAIIAGALLGESEPA